MLSQIVGSPCVLWLNTIPLFIYIPQHLYLFIRQWTPRLFPCLAVINNVTMNIEVQQLNFFDTASLRLSSKVPKCQKSEAAIRVTEHGLVWSFISQDRSAIIKRHPVKEVYRGLQCAAFSLFSLPGCGRWRWRIRWWGNSLIDNVVHLTCCNCWKAWIWPTLSFLFSPFHSAWLHYEATANLEKILIEVLYDF